MSVFYCVVLWNSLKQLRFSIIYYNGILLGEIIKIVNHWALIVMVPTLKIDNNIYSGMSTKVGQLKYARDGKIRAFTCFYYTIQTKCIG